jgi:hypothetical protein
MPVQSAAAARDFDRSARVFSDPADGARVQHLRNADATRAADQARLNDAIGGVNWRRRGVLQILSRR